MPMWLPVDSDALQKQLDISIKKKLNGKLTEWLRERRFIFTKGQIDIVLHSDRLQSTKIKYGYSN